MNEQQAQRIQEIVSGIRGISDKQNAYHPFWTLLRNAEEAADLIEALQRERAQSGWIPCSERNPTEEGCYPVTIEINNPFQHGRYETRLQYNPRYLSNGWYASSDTKLLAWRENAPWSGEVKEAHDD